MKLPNSLAEQRPHEIYGPGILPTKKQLMRPGILIFSNNKKWGLGGWANIPCQPSFSNGPLPSEKPGIIPRIRLMSKQIKLEIAVSCSREKRERVHVFQVSNSESTNLISAKPIMMNEFALLNSNALPLLLAQFVVLV